MIIFIADVFSGHILVKTIIPSELYCCNMIPTWNRINVCPRDDVHLHTTDYTHAVFRPVCHRQNDVVFLRCHVVANLS